MGHIAAAWWTLRLALGLMALLAGVDKFVGLLATWDMYLSAPVSALLPVAPAAFMRLVGLVEIAAGATVLAGWTCLGGYLVAAWLVVIAINLAITGLFYDLAIRDLVLAASAYALAELGQARQALYPGSASR